MIRTVKWKDHNILGNLELKLYNEKTGHIYNTIILAGDNGSGKTTILETLSEFLNCGSFAPFESIEYEVEGKLYTLTRDREDQGTKLGFHQRTDNQSGKSKHISSNHASNSESITHDQEDIRHYGCAYTKARSGFNTKKVTSTSTEQLDADLYENDETDDFTKIKQLLIDIDSQDNREWAKISNKNPGANIQEYSDMFKMARFKNAFNDFFEDLNYEGIDDKNSEEFKVVFEKFGKTISVDDLSTGEKQVVFRGAHLLKNMQSIEGGTVMVDEPELSMHPKWQNKCLQYYRNIFKVPEGEQTVQMFFATHSEYVIRSALEDQDNVLIIVLKNENGEIHADPITVPMALESLTAAEINYLAFDMVSPDYHNQLYGCLQSKTGNNSIKDCDNYILNQTETYDSTLHEKPYDHKNTKYFTLPTYIRTAIDHPDSSLQYTQEELRRSIELLIKLCNAIERK